MSYSSGYAGGYGDLASVTATRGTTWNVRARVTGTRGTTWNVLASPSTTVVAAQRSTTWNVGPTISTVVATRTTTWNVVGRITASRAASWSVLVGVDTTGGGDEISTAPGIRLRVYLPNGADQGPLPTPESVAVAYPLNDVGGLTFSYALRGPRSSLLGQPCEIAVEVSLDGGRTWSEPVNSRFVYISDGRDPIDPADKYSVDCRSYVWRLSKAVILPNGLLNTDGKRAFLSAKPGVILKTLIDEAQGRGWGSGITYTFTTTTDSSGAAWSKQLTIYYEPGLNLLAVLQNLADQGFIDFRMVGRTLHVFNPDATMAADRTIGAGQVTLRPGRDLTEAPFRRTWEGLANYGYFAGEGTNYEYTNPGAAVPWGRQEIFISNGSVTDPGTMAVLTQAELDQTDAERIEYTRGLDFTRATSRPFRDYSVGDYVGSAVNGETPERLRVRQLTLTADAQGIVAGNVVLNDRFLEADIRQKRRIEGITNGASSGTGTGSSTPDPDPGVDTMPPGKVGNLLGSSLAYMGPGGFTQAQVTLSWSPVTLNSDGTPCDDLDHYEIYHHASSTDISTRQPTSPEITTETSISLSPYQAGSNWLFAVRAVDTSGNRGIFSNETTVGMAADTTPPQAPSTPVPTAKLGLVSVAWDGLPATGSWPADFDHVDVHASTINNFTPDTTTRVDQLHGKGVSIYTAGAFGVPIYFKLIAYDKSDLSSTPSAQATATPSRLVGTDISADAITYEQIAFKDPGNIVQDGSFESTAYQQVLTGRSHAAWLFTTADAFHGNTSATIDATVAPSTPRLLQLMASTDDQQIRGTEKLFCRFAYKGTAGATGNLRLVVQWNQADNTTLTSTLEGLVKNGTWQQAAAQLQAPAGVESFRLYFELSNTGTLGNYWVDAIEVRRTVGTAIIEDAAIKNAQIDNLAVNSAKIADLEAGKLTAGTMSADVLIAGRLMTATLGSRVDISSTGIRLYDVANLLKAHMDPATGQFRIYSTGDVTHTSTAHGLQMGQSNAQNLVLDENEIMSRFNGTYSALSLNREGGLMFLGGKIGGFNPDESDAGVIPADADHRIYLRASTHCWNVRNSDYADEFPPLLVGVRGGSHLWMDAGSIGCTGEGGDSPATLTIMPRKADGSNHNVSISVASQELNIERLGTSNSGIRADATADCAIQWFGGAVRIRTNGFLGYQEIQAQAFTVSSEERFKKDIRDFDAVDIIKAAPAKQFKYKPEMAGQGDRWHFGPMAETLPDELVHATLDPTPIPEDQTPETQLSVDVGALTGVTWEAVRQLTARVEALENAS